jgi:hypothetical protein
MPGEVRIHVDVDATGHYVFRVRSGKREITTSVNPDLAASFYEDLRLLRWKSAGVHDPGDILLDHVGDRLAALIAPPATWEELRLPDSALHVRVDFTQAAHRLMPFPWELLRVNERFLIGARGSHVVRDVPAPGGTRRRRPIHNVVHMSLGTDSALRFDEERCTLLETLPANIPIEFLIDPSPRHLEAVMDPKPCSSQVEHHRYAITQFFRPQSKPFIWSAKATDILEKVKRARKALDNRHSA